MKLQLRQHKHLLLGRSDVSGWGAFVKARRAAAARLPHGGLLTHDAPHPCRAAQDDAKKNELLGEYTGELVSQARASLRMLCRAR